MSNKLIKIFTESELHNKERLIAVDMDRSFNKFSLSI